MLAGNSLKIRISAGSQISMTLVYILYMCRGIMGRVWAFQNFTKLSKTTYSTAHLICLIQFGLNLLELQISAQRGFLCILS